MAVIFEFAIGTILASFNLQVTMILPTMFRVSWPFGSGDKGQNNVFKMAAVVAILDFNQNDFSYF